MPNCATDHLSCKLFYLIILLANCCTRSSCWRIVVPDHPFCTLLRQIIFFSQIVHQIKFHANYCTRSTNTRIVVPNHHFFAKLCTKLSFGILLHQKIIFGSVVPLYFLWISFSLLLSIMLHHNIVLPYHHMLQNETSWLSPNPGVSKSSKNGFFYKAHIWGLNFL